MSATKDLFFELVYNFQSERWNEFELSKLSMRELQALAKLLGCSACGTKETLVVRLLAQRELRFKLAPFTDTQASWLDPIDANRCATCVKKPGFGARAQQTRSFGSPAQLAGSVPSTRKSILSRNAIAIQRPSATVNVPVLGFAHASSVSSKLGSYLAYPPTTSLAL